MGIEEKNTTSIILSTLLEIKAQLGSMDTKLEVVNKALLDHIIEDVKEHTSQNEKIKKIENNQNKLKWLALGAGATAAALWRIIEAVGLMKIFR